MTKVKKTLVLLILIALVFCLASCSEKKTMGTDEDVDTLTYWMPLNSVIGQKISNVGNTEFADEIMELFDCTIKFQHPEQGQEGERFNILVASDDIPDIIQYSWDEGYLGGGQKALEYDLIKELDMSKDAPNLKKYLDKHPELKKMVESSNGKYYGYPLIMGEGNYTSQSGLVIRQDWLDELGLAMPETLDEWVNVLLRFKENEKTVKAPLSLRYEDITSTPIFASAFGVDTGLYVDDGKVKFGPMESKFRQYLDFMKLMYANGLLDENFVTNTKSNIKSKMLKGETGAMYGDYFSGIERYLLSEENPIRVTGTKYPVTSKGNVPFTGEYIPTVSEEFAAISNYTECPKLCAKILDYGYSNEGARLFNFGIKGVSYTIKNKKPVFTKLMTENEDDKSFGYCVAQYTMANTDGPYIRNKWFMQQYAKESEQKTALENWSFNNAKEHYLPKLNVLNRQTEDMKKQLEEFTDYCKEYEINYVLGFDDTANYNKFIKGLKTSGIDEYLKNVQKLYDEYVNK